MKQKRKVLWLEDAARYDLAQLVAPVFMNGSFNLTIVENPSDAIAQILQNEFEAIIVDIRLPPGYDEAWVKLYENFSKEKISARLGRHFLYTILGNSSARIKLGARRPVWITPDRIGIFTVESRAELEEDLKKLGITVFQPKSAETKETALLDLIEKVIQQVDRNKR